MAAVPAAAQTRAQLDAARQRMVQTAIIDAGVKNVASHRRHATDAAA